MRNVLLPVPHFEQSRDGACLPACVRMILAFWGDPRPESQIAAQLGTKPFGTPISNVVRLSAWGYDAALVDLMQRPLLERYLEDGKPIIARVWTAMLDYWQQVTSHVVVVIGCNEQGVIINDPALADGGHFILWDAFLAAWAEFDEMAVIIARQRK